MNFFHPKYRHHHNLLLFIIGLLMAIVMARSPFFNQLINYLGDLGYLGAFIAGMLFTSTFTVATGAVILFALAKTLSPIFLILLASIGAVLGDFLIFKFIEDDVVEEIKPIYEQVTGSHLKKILHTRYFAWTLPVIGALIIASPMPDELGVSLLGISEIKPLKFLLISWVSHALGMFFLITASLTI